MSDLKNEWIPVTERLPKIPTGEDVSCVSVLVAIRAKTNIGQYFYSVEIAEYYPFPEQSRWFVDAHETGWFIGAQETGGEDEITHWMPLPEPPEGI
jgi:hypothetical protein